MGIVRVLNVWRMGYNISNVMVAGIADDLDSIDPGRVKAQIWERSNRIKY